MRILILTVCLLLSCDKQDVIPERSQRTAQSQESYVPLTNAWYNNTLDDSMRVSLSSALSDIDWMDANRINGGTQRATLYIPSSLVASAMFPQVVAYASSKSIDIGVAYSQTSEVDAMVAYNQGRTASQRIKYAVTELEPWNTGDYSGMTAKMQYSKPRLRANGMGHLVYIGWPTSSYYPTIVTYADEVNLHCYRMSKDMTINGIWGYVQGRLGAIANEAQAQGRVLPVNVIYSCEPSFALTWFSKHSWSDAHLAFLQAYDQRATAQMRQWLKVNNFSIFVTKYGRQAR
jgi:hypothetical protein